MAQEKCPCTEPVAPHRVRELFAAIFCVEKLDLSHSFVLTSKFDAGKPGGESGSASVCTDAGGESGSVVLSSVFWECPAIQQVRSRSFPDKPKGWYAAEVL